MPLRRSWIRMLSLSLALGPVASGGESSQSETPSASFKAKVSGAESVAAVEPRLDLRDVKTSFGAIRELQSLFRVIA